MADDDFEKADTDAGANSKPIVRPPNGSALPMNVIEYRDSLIQDYHKGAASIIERIRKTNKDDSSSLVITLIEEVVKETDHLLGNELVSAHNGDLRDSSVISFKRAEVLEKAIKAIQTRMELERISGLDVDSPAMSIIFRFFFNKAKETFNRMNVGTEISDLFFSTYGEVTENWKKELRDNYEEMKFQQKPGV